MKSYKWGVIGPGTIAEYFASDLRLVKPPQMITAVLSDLEKSANEFANKYNIEKRFLGLDDFISNSKMDIVYIATPHPLHYEAVKACLQNHIPVLCEKPIVINHEQFEDIQNLSKINKTFMMEGMWIRFLPHVKKLLELISGNKIGEVISVQASMSFKAPRDEGNRYFDPEKGGGSLLDLGVYCVFLSTILLGMPSSIKAIGKLSDKNIDEACAILLSYNNNSYTMLESSLLVKQNGPAEIFGSTGVIRLLSPWFEKSRGIEVESNNGEIHKTSFDWEGHGLQFEIEEVISCISNKKIESDLMPHALTKTILEIMDKIRDQIHVSYPEYE
jgi:predicted dehydrogenase